MALTIFFHLILSKHFIFSLSVHLYLFTRNSRYLAYTTGCDYWPPRAVWQKCNFQPRKCVTDSRIYAIRYGPPSTLEKGFDNCGILFVIHEENGLTRGVTLQFDRITNALEKQKQTLAHCTIWKPKPIHNSALPLVLCPRYIFCRSLLLEICIFREKAPDTILKQILRFSLCFKNFANQHEMIIF